jgi:hypothetical protein
MKVPPVGELSVRVQCPRCSAKFILQPNGEAERLPRAAPDAIAAPALVGRLPPSPALSADPPAVVSAGPAWTRVPLLLGLIAAGVLLLGGGAYLAFKTLAADDRPATEQAQKGTENDPDGSDDDTRDEVVPDDRSGLVADAEEVPDKPAKKKAPQRVVQPPVKPEDPAVAARRKKVNAAIDRGVKYLQDCLTGKQTNVGFYPNNTGALALAGLTLLNCGVKANDPAVVKVVTAVRARVATMTSTYEMACCVWFLDKLNDAKDQAVIQSLALALIANQRVNGGWDYTCPRLSAAQQQDLQSRLKKAGLESKLTGKNGAPKPAAATNFTPQMAVADLAKLPVLQFQPGQKLTFQASPFREDNSNTQFAILALWAAQKHKVPTARSLALAEARFRASQNTDGSWAYVWINNNVTNTAYCDSMSCAGLLGLAVGRGVQKAAKGAKKTALVKDPVVAKALAYLGKTLGRATPNPPMPGVVGKTVGANSHGDLYFLWSLERVGVVYNLTKIQDKDWYAWGADLLLKTQTADGSWRERHAGVVDTCFALLFLKRVNVVKDLTTKLQQLD